VQGEGDYKAARRYNEATREFVQDEDVAELRATLNRKARAKNSNWSKPAGGRQRAKDEDPLLDRPKTFETTKTSRK
jgi:hypothetical protein